MVMMNARQDLCYSCVFCFQLSILVELVIIPFSIPLRYSFLIVFGNEERTFIAEVVIIFILVYGNTS